MNLENLGLYVLANMAAYPERSLALCEKLRIRGEDFAIAAQQATFAAFADAGDKAKSHSLLNIAFKQLMPSGGRPLVVELDDGTTRTLKTADDFAECFVDLAPSLANVDHWLYAFAKATAEARFNRELMALSANRKLDAALRIEEIKKLTAEHEARLNEINAMLVSGGKAADDDADISGAPEIIDPELLKVPGFIGALADYTFRTAPRPNRILAFVGALSMMSYLAGRKFTDHRNTCPNLYLVALAGSGCGKDHPRKVNKKIGMTIKDHNGVCDQIASGQGLEDALLIRPTRLFQMDEFDTMLNQLKDKSAVSEGIMRYVLNFFSDAGACHVMRKKALTDADRQSIASGMYNMVGDTVIYYPSLTIFGTAIPEQFYKSLSERALTNGLLSRCLVFESGNRGPRGTGDAREPIPDEIVYVVNALSSREDDEGWREDPKLFVVPDGEGAAEALQKMRDDEDRRHKQCEREKDVVGQAVWVRGGEIANKLALVYAISENVMSPVITPAGIEWAWKVFCHCAERMLWMARTYVSDSKDEETLLKVLDYIREFGRKGVNRHAVGRKLHLSKRNLDEIEETLLDRKDIECSIGSGNAKIYRAINRKNRK